MSAIQIRNSEQNETPSFKSLFHWDIGILRLMGISSMSGIFTDHKMNSKWWEGGPILISVITIGTVLMLQLYTISYTIRNQLSYAIILLSSIAPNLACIVKLMRLWRERSKVYELLQILGAMWESARSDNKFTSKMTKAAEYTKSLTKYYTIGVCFMCSLYIIYPYSVTATAYFHKEFNSSVEYSANVFPFDIPYKINSPFIFVISVTFQQIGAFAVSIIWAECDTLFAQLTCHITLQFMVIANELKAIIDNCQDLGDDRTSQMKLTKVINRYQELFICCHSVQTFFNPIIFFTIISNGISLCACAYRLNDNVMNARWGELPNQTLALLSTSVQTMIYCTFAEGLTKSSGAVKDGIHNSHWIHCNRRLKKALLIIMIRAQKEFKYTAYNMMDINYNQLTQIFNAAMSYFMLLRNVS